MTDRAVGSALLGRIPFLFLLIVAGAGASVPAHAQSSLPAGFPSIPVWSYPGAFRGGADSVATRARTITVRWLRDPAAEQLREFGGYRIYRVYNSCCDERDSLRMVLVRRYSVQSGDSLFLWHFATIDASTPLEQRVATFTDPDSSGNLVKRCRNLDRFGRCISRGDSIYVLMAPPGPHDGFRAWYSITYELRDTTDFNYEDMYVRDPDSRCASVTPDTCNLNHKYRSRTGPVEATPGPAQNLEKVAVVPNPFRAAETWDRPGGNEVHFVNLPPEAHIRIYSVAGDLVRDLRHADPLRDFEVWDLRNGHGQEVASGIYVYRVEAGVFAHQSRFVVIR